MKFLFLSVKHSGMRVCKNSVFRNYESEYRHFEEHSIKDLTFETERFNAVIIPLRNPDDVAQSWVNRGYRMNELFLGFERQAVFEKMSLSPVYYLPTDHPERDNFVESIERELAVDLHKEWPQVSSGIWPERNMPAGLVIQIGKEVYEHPFYKKWYPQ